MAGPPGDKQAGQQHLPNQDKDAIGGAEGKSSPRSTSHNEEYNYDPFDTDKSHKTDKQVSDEVRKHNGHNHHEGAEYTGATSSYYKVSIEELRKIHKQLDGMAEAAKDDLEQARRIVEAKPPAEDQDGSVMHAKALQKWGHQLRAEAKQHYQAVSQYRDNLQNIIKDYSASEKDAMVTFKDFQGEL